MCEVSSDFSFDSVIETLDLAQDLEQMAGDDRLSFVKVSPLPDYSKLSLRDRSIQPLLSRCSLEAEWDYEQGKVTVRNTIDFTEKEAPDAKDTSPTSSEWDNSSDSLERNSGND
jgi:hypothetical protein